MKKQDKNLNIRKTNLFLRITSGVGLFFIYGLYIAFSVLNNEIWVQHQNKVLSYVFGGVFILLTVTIMCIAMFELTRTFGLKNKWVVTGYCIIGLGVYLLPLGSFVSLSTGIFIYNYSSNLLTFLSNGFFQTFSLIALFGLFVLFSKTNNLSILDSFWISFISVVIIFGLKGVTNLSLSIDYRSDGANGLYNSLKFGYPTTIWVWLTIILTDSFAYIFGSVFGKHKMAPKISPKKSWEGAIAGFIISIVISLAIALLVLFLKVPINIFNIYSISFSQAQFIILIVLLAILISIICQLGDLFFSYIKRKAEIKDFSNIIPGHGGVLDRLDSFIVVFCFLFFVTLFV